MFVDSTWAGNYCDTATTVLDIFRRDGDCWDPYHPAVRFNLQPAEVTLTPSANMVCDTDSVTTVSYTHLDVYKRQGRGRCPARQRRRRPGPRRHRPGGGGAKRRYATGGLATRPHNPRRIPPRPITCAVARRAGFGRQGKGHRLPGELVQR